MLTEERNPRTEEIDRLSTLAVLKLINREDASVAEAVRSTLPKVAIAVDRVSKAIEAGGRLFYIGAGSSGRLGVLDAAECATTFGIDNDLIQGVLAGQPKALYRAVEWAEDVAKLGQDDLKARGVTCTDAVVGISASGKTPYTIGALRYAQRLGCPTVGISCNQRPSLAKVVDVSIEALVGPEVISGSTRMKAGTAQKMILNMMSTAVMIHLGNVYSNLMVNLKLTNRKLVDRGVRIISEAVGITIQQARKALQEAGDVRSAIVMLQLKCTSDEARGLMAQSERVNEVLRASQQK
jgi:N-acetylmuramic acid 6-phosphate etherase